jgi:hypothetical protein
MMYYIGLVFVFIEERSCFLELHIIGYFLLKMLHARTSSAINLRMESGRRHAIRNLKAKVRSLLPADICAR